MYSQKYNFEGGYFHFALNVKVLFLFIAFNFRFTFVTLQALSIFFIVQSFVRFNEIVLSIL